MTKSSPTALVTGGAGFIGSNLCGLLLDKGWKVRVLDDLSVGRKENLDPAVEFILGDVCDGPAADRACQGVDAVFHLAARVTIRHSVETFVEDAQTNLMGTTAMLRAAGRAGARRFVLASSMGVYADSPGGQAVSEDHLAEPLSPYGISKLAAERYTLMMAPALSMEPVVLRLFNTYGPNQGYSPYVGVVTIFATNIAKNRPCTIFGDGSQCRDYVHVADVAGAFYLAATKERAAGGVFNVGTGRGTTVMELSGLIRGIMGKGEFVFGEKHGTELTHSVPDIHRAREVLGYEPKGVLEERLPRVVEAIRGRVG